MATIHDVIPPQARVSLPYEGGEVDVDVRGLSLDDISDLMWRFPEIIEQFDGKLDVAALMKLGPRVVAAIMACGCGARGDNQVELNLLQMNLSSQAEIMAIVVKLTAPKGVGPFVKLLQSLGFKIDPDMVRSAWTSALQSAKSSPASSEEATATMN
jgi:hypothetical protein